jgi:DNA invertase Pin-like site-specific DNA recombinase|tara:strand:+ start:448 stop:1041 length:594 start_codon:yes stop_codon:yes gene_type:complete
MTNVCLYLRVSSAGQTTDNQEIELVELCKRRNFNIVEVYKETISGTKKNEDRKELTRMLGEMKQRRWTKIVIYDLTRLGRSVSEVVKTLSMLDDYNISLFSMRQNLDTDDGGMSKLFFYFVSIFSEMESELRKSRQKIGIERVRKLGKKYGGNDFISDEIKSKVFQLNEEGLSYRKIKQQIPNVSIGSISNIVRGTC